MELLTGVCVKGLKITCRAEQWVHLPFGLMVWNTGINQIPHRENICGVGQHDKALLSWMRTWESQGRRLNLMMLPIFLYNNADFFFSTVCCVCCCVLLSI
jgi:hypothetical protein